MLAFMGYSENPARDLTNGFTVAGPVYGDQAAYLAQCGSNRWSSVAHVGLRVNFLDPKSAAKLPDETTFRREIQNQLQTLGQNSHMA